MLLRSPIISGLTLMRIYTIYCAILNCVVLLAAGVLFVSIICCQDHHRLYRWQHSLDVMSVLYKLLSTPQCSFAATVCSRGLAFDGDTVPSGGGCMCCGCSHSVCLHLSIISRSLKGQPVNTIYYILGNVSAYISFILSTRS